MSITTTELHWVDATTAKPDHDRTVLIWSVDEHGATDWTTAWWDGLDWHLCESGGICGDAVTHWAEPAGPIDTNT